MGHSARRRGGLSAVPARHFSQRVDMQVRVPGAGLNLSYLRMRATLHADASMRGVTGLKL
jgi:hypothetical protein